MKNRVFFFSASQADITVLLYGLYSGSIQNSFSSCKSSGNKLACILSLPVTSFILKTFLLGSLLYVIASEFIKHYNLSELVDDSVYLYNSDVKEMKKDLEQIDKKINSKKR